MGKHTTILLEQEVRDSDIPDIAKAFGDDHEGLVECDSRIQIELERIRLNPMIEGTWCEFEPLKSAGHRKVKLFSCRALQLTRGKTPDMRIIYLYDKGQDTVKIFSIGFRKNERPRPDSDPYSKAERE